MIDNRAAFKIEKQVFELLKRSKRLSKYKLELHYESKYGIDVQVTAPGYEEFGIEIESTRPGKWPTDAPYPTGWRWFSVPTRKKKFFEERPMSVYIKVNHDMTRAAVIPLSYVIASDTKGYRNEVDNQFECNDFYVMFDPEHPALCFCKIEKLAIVVDEQLQQLVKMKKSNAKYTDMRPKFGPKPKKRS